MPLLSAAEGRLLEARGAFVTLHKAGHLRGCIGHVESFKSLCETVRECAVAAALSDPRFEPVAPAELSSLNVEVSVLSVMGEKVRIGIQAPQEIPVFRKEIYLEIHRDDGTLEERAPSEVDDALEELGESER